METNVDILFKPFKKRVKAMQGSNLLKVAIDSDIPLTVLCNRNGACGKCKVVIESGKIKPPKEIEEILLSDEERAGGLRLACMVEVTESLVVRIPPESMERDQLFVEGEDLPGMPAVARPSHHFKLTDVTHTVSEVREASSYDRFILDRVGEGYSISYQCLRTLADRLREGFQGWAVLDEEDREIIDVKLQPALYGVAIDIGTTTLTGAVVDMRLGQTVVNGSLLNPQITFGGDLISRLKFLQEDKRNLKRLQKSLVNGVNYLIEELLKSRSLNEEDIYEVFVVGNPVMQHLFLGLDPLDIGIYPNIATLSTPYRLKLMQGSPLSLKVHTDARVSIFPISAKFVGGDTIAAILSSGIQLSDKPSLLVDLGTNGEIVLGSRNGLMACSASAGPSFEGYAIGCGVRAVKGAIQWVKIRDDSEVFYGTLHGGRPVGLCGSGIISLIAELLSSGLIDEKGKFVRKGSPGRWTNEGFVLVPEQDTLSGKPIVITQHHIQEVQKAKAAIYTGITILMERAGLTVEDLEKVYLTGSFGSSINREDAITIGLIPPVPLDKIEVAGYAPLKGAIMSLLDRKKIEESCKIASMVHHIDLGSIDDFEDRFISALYFCHAMMNQQGSLNAYQNIMRL